MEKVVAEVQGELCLTDGAVASDNKKSQKGASMVEYALLIGLVAVVGIVAITQLGQKVSGQFSKAASQI